jgi:hypothetical protein
VETAVIDLVGDLAAYRPHAKIVLVEGSGPTPFDVALIKRLFPELTERANFVAAGSRSETVRIAKRLQEIVEGSGLAGRVVTVTDRDLPEIDSDGTVAVWPVYEIENFLLEPSLLRRTLKALLREDPLRTDASTREVLKSVARNLVDGLALTRVQRILNEEFRRSMDIGGKTESAVSDLSASAAASQHRITTLDVSEKRIEKLFQETRASFSRTIETDQFLEDFPGKRLLSGFAGKHGLNADVFRNVLLDQAQQIKFRPERLERLLCELLD